MNEFIRKHDRNILGVLSGFDRVRFRGTIRMLACVPGLMYWLLDRQILLKQFHSFAMGLTADLKNSVQQVAAAAGRAITYVASSSLSKEDLANELLRREGITHGLVCVLSCVEPCQTFYIYRNRETKFIDLAVGLRKCLHYYFYFIDTVLGLCHVRIQSWLPFTVHICINGREWLCRELSKANIAFRRSDNCLLNVANVKAAQRFLDAQPWAPWCGILNGLLDRACPWLCRLPASRGILPYYWSADETEWATDLMFRTAPVLGELYPSLIRHGITTFSSRDVMRFLGRTKIPKAGVPSRFQGEVVTDLSCRPEGLRIRHRLNKNSVKMYDKQGSVLRIETTINDARDMRVYRVSESNPTGKKSSRRLRKGVVDLPRRAQISQAANARYLTALAAVDATTPLGRVLDAVSKPVIHNGHRSRGLNPMTGDDARLTIELLRGEFALNGFRNRDIRELLFPSTTDPAEVRRQSGRVTRLLRLFRDHGLIRKIKGTHRYHLTSRARATLPAFTAARSASTKELNKIAA